MPVFSFVAGDVGAVGAYGDPEFLSWVVGYGAAVAVGWGLGGLPIVSAVGLGGRIRRVIRFEIVTADCDSDVARAPVVAEKK